jgi:hypothetical protein
MQTEYCDKCGVLVPAAHIAEGRSFKIDGKIICGTCRQRSAAPAARPQMAAKALAGSKGSAAITSAIPAVKAAPLRSPAVAQPLKPSGPATAIPKKPAPAAPSAANRDTAVALPGAVSCDVCGLAIPPKHFAEGRAIRSAGKVICGVCQERPALSSLSGRNASVGGKTSTHNISVRSASGAANASISVRTPGSTRQEITSSTVISTRSTISAQHWICAGCGKALGKDALESGAGKLLQGRLTCAACVKKAPGVLAAAGIGWPVLAGVAALFGVGLIVFPGHAIFMVIIAAGLALLTGVLGFRLSGIMRIGLVAAGIVAMAGSFIALSQLGARNEQQQKMSAVAKEAGEIQALLQEEKFADAQGRFPALEEMAKAPPPRDGFITPEAERLVTETRAQLDAWVKKSYGVQGDVEAQVMMALIGVYPERTSTGEKRVRSIRVEGDKLLLTLYALSRPDSGKESRTPGAPNRDVLDEARGYLVLLFDKFPQFERAELKLEFPGDGPPPQTFNVDREQVSRLKSVRDPAEVLGN